MEKIRTNGLSANALKCFAMATMFIDHLAFIIAPDPGALNSVMHFIGQITAPIFFYFVAVGYRYTHNANRYTLRLALFALVSYLPFLYLTEFSWPFRENFLKLNVIFTILLGFPAECGDDSGADLRYLDPGLQTDCYCLERRHTQYIQGIRFVSSAGSIVVC